MPDRSTIRVIRLDLTSETIRLGGRILSRMQGCEDPLGQREYYSDLFTELMEQLVQEGAAALVS